MNERNAKILWLAAADARGHLMRAHIVRQILAPRGTEVEVVTTSEAGRAFLAALGTPSRLLSPSYAVAFDARQNLDRARTRATILRYLLSPSGFAGDLSRLDRYARSSTLVVNDFHPALLLAPKLRTPIVHVHGTYLWQAIAGHFSDHPLSELDRLFSSVCHALRGRALGVIEHTLDDARLRVARLGPRHHLVQPTLALPRRTPERVRRELGLGSGDKFAAVYLNPHFRDPAIALAIERAVAHSGLALYAVGEGFASRPGWRVRDPDFAGAAAAANVLISAPGMGALALSRTLGLPLCALVTSQPEQQRNLAFLKGFSSPTAVLDAAAPDLERAAQRALQELATEARAPIDAREAICSVHAQWAVAIESLLCRARATRRAHGPLIPSWRTVHV